MTTPNWFGEILLVEDNPGDVRLTQEMLNEGGLSPTIHVVNDGIKAMDFLLQQGQYVDAPEPDVILLDLHLPKMSGDEVLAELENNEDLSHIPVIVLTGSKPEEAARKLDSPKTEATLMKPIEPDTFTDVVRSFEDV